MSRKGKILSNHSISRGKLIQWLPAQQPSLVAMESCGGSGYWGRLAKASGHELMMIPPRQVKLFRTGQKTDANDAIAIAVASRTPNIKAARCSTLEQQELQCIEKMREMVDKQKLQLSNQIRGLLLEFGIVINKGDKSFKERIPEILEDAENQLSPSMRESLFQLWELHARLGEDFKVLDTRLKQLVGEDSDCQRLMNLEGVGPITSTKLKLQLGHGEHFKNGRQAAACIGVTPKQHSSGGKAKMGSVGMMACDRSLRSCLFLGARSVVSRLKNRQATTEKERWLKRLVERRGVNCALMALANKTVRTAYALLKNNTDYKPEILTAGVKLVTKDKQG